MAVVHHQSLQPAFVELAGGGGSPGSEGSGQVPKSARGEAPGPSGGWPPVFLLASGRVAMDHPVTCPQDVGKADV
jgi:hypothetical protein